MAGSLPAWHSRSADGRGQSRYYSKDEMVHQIRDLATELFFIQSGTVRFGAVDHEGKELIARDLDSDHWFMFR
ncbi:cyclic nucleotide-binding domain-containing protein [Phaeobacter porticola]|nr:cyclic nucleotide-binding domain-containing protein [Phaeobacter porticola]